MREMGVPAEGPQSCHEEPSIHAHRVSMFLSGGEEHEEKSLQRDDACPTGRLRGKIWDSSVRKCFEASFVRRTGARP